MLLVKCPVYILFVFQMTISVNKVENGKLISKHEFLVDRALTVQSLLQAACQLMDCEGRNLELCLLCVLVG